MYLCTQMYGKLIFYGRISIINYVTTKIYFVSQYVKAKSPECERISSRPTVRTGIQINKPDGLMKDYMVNETFTPIDACF